MPLVGLRAFVAGVAVGWAGRAVAGSTRETLVRLVVAGHAARTDLQRAVAERWEWIEDLMAEGRIRYEESVARGEGGAPPDHRDPRWPGVGHPPVTPASPVHDGGSAGSADSAGSAPKPPAEPAGRGTGRAA
jgi:hypothetical protein